MELINGRYKIEGCVEQDYCYSKYIALDLFKKNEKVYLILVNDIPRMRSFIRFCNKNFYEISSLIHPSIVSVYSYGIVETVDDKKLEEEKFFYTTEYIEVYTPREKTEGWSKEKIFQFYKELARALDFLHFRGGIYQYIGIDTVKLCCTSSGVTIKLLDLITLKLMEMNRQYLTGINLSCMAPELTYGIELGFYTDIYSMGALLFYLFTGEEFRQSKLNKKIKLESIKVQKTWEYGFLQVIKNTTNVDFSERYQSIHEINKEIQDIFDCNTTIEDKVYVERLNFQIPLIGRELEVEQIQALVQSYDQRGAQLDKNLIILSGDKKIGKSRLLNEIQHLVKWKKHKVIGTSVEGKEDHFYKLAPKILRQMLRFVAQDVIEKYSKDLVKLIPEIGINKGITPSRELSEHKEVLKLYDRVSNFIVDGIGDQITLITLDDFQGANKTIVEFIDYLINVASAKKAPLLVMITLREGQFEWIEGNSYLNKWVLFRNTLYMKLGRLTVEETAKMIKHILGCQNKPLELAAKILKDTDGNPGYIEEALRELFALGLLVVDHKENAKGFEWKITVDDYTKIQLTSNMDQAIFNQIKNLEEKELKILEIVSIFHTSISSEIIRKMLDTEENDTTLLFHLTQLKILNEKLEDWGYTYGFYSKELKNAVYNSISAEEKLRLHALAGRILEDSYSRDGRENKDELIHHLLQANQKDKVIDYCIESGDNMFRLRIYAQALSFYKKALALMNSEEDARKLVLLIRLGDTYQNQGNNKEAVHCFLKALDVATLQKENYRYIDTKNKLCNIYLLRNELSLAEENLLNTLSFAEKIQYREGILEAAFLLSRTYMHSRELEKMRIANAKYGALAQKWQRDDYNGMFFNQMGVYAYLQGRIEESLNLFKRSIDCLENTDRVDEMARPINNMGVILHDHFQDTENARKYYERSLKIAQQYHRIDDTIRAFNNIADAYMLDNQYDQAIEVLQKNLQMIMEYEEESIRLLAYSNLIRCYMNTGEYKQAYTYLLKAQGDYEQYGYSILYSEVFLEVTAKFYVRMGLYDRAIDIIKSFFEKFKNVERRIELRMKSLYYYVQEALGEPMGETELLHIIKDYRGSSYIRDYRNILLRSALYFYNKNERQKAEKLLEEDLDLSSRFDNDYFRVKRKYILALIVNNPGERIESCENLLSSLSQMKYRELQWKIYVTLAKDCFRLKDYYGAINYYLNALENVQVLFDRVPDEFQQNYLLDNGRYKIKQQLIAVEKMLQRGQATTEERRGNITKVEKDLAFDVEHFFDISKIEKLFQNPQFYKLALMHYERFFQIDVHSLEDVIKNLSHDPRKNLCALIKLAARNLLATKAAIVSKDEYGLEILVSFGNAIELEEIQHLIEKTSNQLDGLLIKNNIHHFTEVSDNTAKKDARAVICLPLMKDDDKEHITKERRNYQRHQPKVIGYIYLETDKIFNNFTEQAFTQLKELLPFGAILIDNYQLQITAAIDKLTGVYTRKYFERILKEQIQMAKESEEAFSLIMCDIDYFKGVNDTYGHQKGDMILTEVGRIIKSNIRRSDAVGRYGGEEFIILLPGTRKKDAYDVAEKVRREFEEAQLLGSEHKMTISCGVASFPEDGVNETTIIERADQALYAAKDQGRNQVVLWERGIGLINKRVDKLAGIITGNIVQDQRNVLVLTEALELMSEWGRLEDKIFIVLGRLIEMLEAEEGGFFRIKEGKIAEKYFRKCFQDDWMEHIRYNPKLVERSINTSQGEYLIDWEDTNQIDLSTGIPNWKSVIVSPVTFNGDVEGVIYLSTAVKKKEFDFSAYNLVKITSNILGGLFAMLSEEYTQKG